MNKFKYNLIAAAILVMQLMSLGLIYTKFGASEISDIILISLSIVGAIHLLQIAPIDQFMIYFHRCKSQVQASEFWHYSLVISLLIGIISFAAAEILIRSVSVVLESSVLNKYNETANILKYALILYPILFLNDKVFNCKQYIAASYALSSITHLFIFISLLIVLAADLNGGNAVAWAYTTGVWVGAIFSTYVIASVFDMPLKFNLNFSNRWEFHSNSIQIRIGHNLVAVLFPFITNFYLTRLPEGAASLFHYAHRGVLAIYSVSAGPSFKLYMAKISQFWADNEHSNSKNEGRLFAASSIRAYLVMIGLAYSSIVLLKGNEFIFGRLNHLQIDQLKTTYLLIALWQGIVLYESRYVGILIVSNSSRDFVWINSLFILIYFSVVYLFNQWAGLYAVCLGAISAQTLNAFLYYKVATRKLISASQ